jgi:thioredoxin 1
MSAALEVTEANFDAEVLKSDKVVLVDFWAPWCGPCRRIAPVIDELANEYAGSVKVVKLNVDDAQSLSQSYGVQSIPTLMIFKGGEVVDRQVGVPPKTRLQQALDAAKG